MGKRGHTYLFAGSKRVEPGKKHRLLPLDGGGWEGVKISVMG